MSETLSSKDSFDVVSPYNDDYGREWEHYLSLDTSNSTNKKKKILGIDLNSFFSEDESDYGDRLEDLSSSCHLESDHSVNNQWTSCSNDECISTSRSLSDRTTSSKTDLARGECEDKNQELENDNVIAAIDCINELMLVFGGDKTMVQQEPIQEAMEPPETRLCSTTNTMKSFELNTDDASTPLSPKSVLKLGSSNIEDNDQNTAPLAPKSEDSSVTEDNNDENTAPIKRKVSFTKLLVREYDVALSDNPSCSNGPPIQLGWSYGDQYIVDIDSYEEYREPRRKRNQMKLPYHIRRYMLLNEGGYTTDEVAKAVQEVERCKKQQRESPAVVVKAVLDRVFSMEVQ